MITPNVGQVMFSRTDNGSLTVLSKSYHVNLHVDFWGEPSCVFYNIKGTLITDQFYTVIKENGNRRSFPLSVIKEVNEFVQNG